MTYYSIVGDWQEKDFWPSGQKEKEILNEARSYILNGDVKKANNILGDLIDKNNPEALYLFSTFSFPESETDEEYERRRIKVIKQSAKMGYAPAIYVLGVEYDSGDLIDKDPAQAAELFRQAAEAGHAHSQWIHGIDLIYGTNGITKNEQLGIEYIKESAAAKFTGALKTLSEFYETGKYGFNVDIEYAKKLRNQLNDDDVIDY